MTLVLAGLAMLAAGMIAPVLLVRSPRIALVVSMIAIFIASALLVVVSLAILLGATPGAIAAAWPLPLGIVALDVDGLSAWFLMTLGVLSACVAVYTPAYMKPMAEREPIHVFGGLMCVLVAALVLVVCAADAVLFIAGWELTSLAAFFLVSFEHDRAEVRRGGWMYLVATHIATVLCVVPLFAVLATAAGSTTFSAFPAALAQGSRAMPITLFVLGVIGFGTKAGFFPMHVWLPVAHPVAPTPVSALLSGVVVKIGIYGILRTLTWLPPLPSGCAYGLLALGVASGLMGVLYALMQHDLKRLLAYHTVENIGIIGIGIAVGMLGQARHDPVMTVLGYGGALLHVTNHALFKGLLFMSAGAVLHSTGTVNIERLGGLAKRTPVNATMFLIGAVAICGLPPLNGFLSEWVIYGGLWSGAMLGAGVAPAFGILSLALMGGLALACFAKVHGIVFLGEPRDAALRAHATPAAMRWGMGLLALGCVCIGVLPFLWIPLTHTAVAVLSGFAPEDVGPHMEGMVSLGVELTVIAGVFAAIAAGLMGLRWFTNRGRDARAPRTRGAQAVAPTWGCGFAAPTARMQYTPTSFAAPLIHSFRNLVWPERSYAAPAGPFPVSTRVETHAPDIAEREFFQPLFQGIVRLFTMLKTVSWSGAPASVQPPVRRWGPLNALFAGIVGGLRRGSIHVYLLFIVMTLILLFLVEGISPSHRIGTGAADPPTQGAGQ